MKPFYRGCLAVIAGFVVFAIGICIMAWLQTNYKIKPGYFFFIINFLISAAVSGGVDSFLKKKFPQKSDEKGDVEER